MGREIKRVALDFDWPLAKIWAGYENPHYQKCPAPGCDSGMLPAYDYIEGIVTLLSMLAWCDAEQRPHPYLEHIPHLRRGICPDVMVREFVQGLAGRKDIGPGIGSDWAIMKALFNAAGVPEDWGLCKHCKGEGWDPTTKAQRETWVPTEPPAGAGWQVWETVSDGSPISPVFATREELIDWLVQPGKGPGGWDRGYTRAAAEAFVQDGGSVPSLMIVGDVMYRDIEIAGRKT